MLALTTLNYTDEIVPAVGVPAAARVEVPLHDQEIPLAERLIGMLSGHFQPERYHDERRDKILAYLQFVREFNERFPGFDTDVHGLVIEEDNFGRKHYFVDCVRDVPASH